MATLAPNTIDCQILQFKQLCKLKTCPDRSKKVYQNPTQLVATSSLYGLTFIGEQSGLKSIIKLYETEQISENNLAGLNPKNVVKTYLHKNVPLPSAPSHIDVNSDQQFLSVAFCKNETPFLHVYEIRTLLDNNPVVFSEVRLSSVSNAYVTDLSWNPSISTVLTCCISDKTLSVYTFNSNGSFEIRSLPKESNSLCVCWSPKGKQLVVGNDNGYLTQYLPELKAMKNYPPPSDIFDKPCSLCSIKWLSNFQFIGVYKLQTPSEEDGDYKTSVIIINTSKNEPVTYVNYEDICFSSGKERPCQFYFIHIAPWNMIFASSSNAVEVSVLKQQPDSVSWCQWILEDSVRITLPMSGVNETFPVGIAVDYSSPIQSQIGENFFPMPIISVLTCEGVLCLYVINYFDPNAPNICIKPRLEPQLKYFTNTDVTTEEEVIPVQRTVPVVNVLAFSSPQLPVTSNDSFTTTFISKPVDVENTVSVGLTTTNLPQLFDSLPHSIHQNYQSTISAFSDQFATSNNLDTHTVITSNNKLTTIQKTKTTYFPSATVDDTVTVSKSDILAKARHECLKKFKKSASTFERDISEINELVNNIVIEINDNVLPNIRLKNLETDTKRLMKLELELTNEVDSIKISLVEVFACIQDIKTKYFQLTNPSYRTLLGAQHLDPVNETSLKKVENNINYVESQLEKANQQLDEFWCKYNEHSSPTRMKIPILDNVYETMMRQQKILQILELEAERIQKRIIAVKNKAKCNQWVQNKQDLTALANRALDDMTLAEFTQKALTIKGDYYNEVASNNAKELARKFSLEHARRFHTSNLKLLKLQELHSGISVTYIQSSRLQRLKKKSLILLSKSAYTNESATEDEGEVVAEIPRTLDCQKVEESYLRLVSPVSSDGENLPYLASVLEDPNRQSIVSSTPVKNSDKCVAARFPIEPSISMEVPLSLSSATKTTSSVPTPKTESDRLFTSRIITLPIQSKLKDVQLPVPNSLAFSSNAAASTLTNCTIGDLRPSSTTSADAKDASSFSFLKNLTPSSNVATESSAPKSLFGGDVTITPVGTADNNVTFSSASLSTPPFFAKSSPTTSTAASTAGGLFFGGLLSTSSSSISTSSTFFSNASMPASVVTATSSAPVSIFSGNKLGSSDSTLFGGLPGSAGLVTSSSSLPVVSNAVKVSPFLSSNNLNVNASSSGNSSPNTAPTKAISLTKSTVITPALSTNASVIITSAGTSTIFGDTGSMFGKGSIPATSNIYFGSVLPPPTSLFGTKPQQVPLSSATISNDKKASAFSTFNFGSKLPENTSTTTKEVPVGNSNKGNDADKENKAVTVSADISVGGTQDIGSVAQKFSFAAINTVAFTSTKTNLYSAPPSSSVSTTVSGFAPTTCTATTAAAGTSDSPLLLSNILSSKPASSALAGSVSGGNLFQAVPATPEAALPTAAATSPTAVAATLQVTPAPASVTPAIQHVTPTSSPPAEALIPTSVEISVVSPAVTSPFESKGTFFEGLSLSATTTTSAPSASIFGKPSAGGSSIFGGNLFGQNTTPGTAANETKSIFGSSSIFGGSNGANTESQNLFSTVNTAPFSENQASVFGSNSVFGNSPNFGNTNVNATPQNAFGSSSGGMLFSGGVTGGFSSTSNSIFQNNAGGFGSPPSFGTNMPSTLNSGGFGSPPTFSNTFTKSSFASFGGAATFGGAPAFGGSPTKVFGQGTPNQGAFANVSPQQPTTFETLATENTMTFGNLAQQQTPAFGSTPSFVGANRQPSFGQSSFGGSSFSSWR